MGLDCESVVDLPPLPVHFYVEFSVAVFLVISVKLIIVGIFLSLLSAVSGLLITC